MGFLLSKTNRKAPPSASFRCGRTFLTCEEIICARQMHLIGGRGLHCEDLGRVQPSRVKNVRPRVVHIFNVQGWISDEAAVDRVRGRNACGRGRRNTASPRVMSRSRLSPDCRRCREECVRVRRHCESNGHRVRVARIDRCDSRNDCIQWRCGGRRCG